MKRDISVSVCALVNVTCSGSTGFAQKLFMDPDEGQRVRNIGKVIKIRILGQNDNKIAITVGVGG